MIWSYRSYSLRAGAVLCAAILANFTSPSAQSAPVTALTYSANPWSFPNGSYNYGWTFTTSTSLNVTALGVWDKSSDGLGEAHQAGIWNSGGTLLASTTIPSGTGATLVSSGSGGFRFTDLGSPLTLPAGTYTVAAHFPTGADEVAGGVTFGNLTMAPFVTYGESRQGGGAFAMPGSRIIGDEIAFFGGNFQYSLVPEPATLALGGFAVAGLLLVARRKLRQVRAGS